MNYEKEYKELKAGIKKAYLFAQTNSTKAVLEHILPELKESKGEKIRKNIISYLHNEKKVKRYISDIEFDKWIAWLEKQGESDKTKAKRLLIYKGYPIDANGELPTYEDMYSIIKDGLEKQEKQVEINPSEFDLRLNKLLKQFENLPKEELADSLGFYLNVVQNDGTYKADENQNEQKSQGKSALDSWKDMRLEVYQQASGNRHEPNYSDDATKMFSLNDIDEIFEKITESSEKKPADNIEPTDYNSIDPHFGKPIDMPKPKFHEGEWVVWQDKCYKVNFNGCGYELIDQNGLSTSLEYGTIDKDARFWTIKDAKDGDVLVTKDGRPFIFRGCTDSAHPSMPVAYCGINCTNSLTINKEHLWWTNDKVCPATKEQCDILFAKIHEAGFTFDFKKKELKEIDGLWHAQRILEKTLGSVDGYQTDDGILDHKAAITAVKNLDEKKPAWNEDDENILNNLINYLKVDDALQYSEKQVVEWLQLVKQRIGE